MENKKNTGSTFPLPPKNKNYNWKKWVKFIWRGLVAIVLGIALLFFAISQGFLGKMPDVNQLENPDIFVASEIYSSDGQLLGKFEKEKTQPIVYSQLPNHLVFALMAKEDLRFKEHSGIDLQGIARAVVFGGRRGGGSTISQQLAKLLFTGERASNPVTRGLQKLKEWIVAVSLEKRYTKDEIIMQYFNKFDFLHNANGIEMASKIYFNKSTSQLTLPEAAMFVAMLENPRQNNPLKNIEKAKKRRDVVLKLMLENKYLDEATYEKAIATPVVVDYHPINDITEGYSAYYKYYLRKQISGYLDDYEKQTGKKLSLFKDGLKIYITLDSKMQKYAEEAVREHMATLQKNFDAEQRGRKQRPFYYLSDSEINNVLVSAMKRTGRYKQLKEDHVPEDSIMLEFKTPVKMQRFTWNGQEDVEMSPWDSIRYHKQIAQAGLMSIVPSTGEIKAWVGGIDWQHFQYDHVYQGKRQVGSTFKPFVYAASIINLGLTPCSVVSNAPFVKGSYRVSEGGGSATMKDAVARSLNPPPLHLLNQMGASKAISLARDLGIQSDIPNNLTIALGSSEITIYEMVGAYSTFANYGNYVKPEMVWRIEDANGRVIKEVKPLAKEVMNEMHAYAMIDLLKGVNELSYSTSYGELRRRGVSPSIEIACKTGTTNENSDGWFIGLTPNLATGVWVGWEDRATHFASTGEGQGARMALPIWAIFMKKVWADKTLNIKEDDKFVKPSDWTGDCSDLQGLRGGYGDEGGLRTIDEIKNPKEQQPEKSPAKKEENLNEKLNSGDETDFNK